MGLKIDINIDEYKAFELLLQALHVNLNEDIKKEDFTIEDGEIVVKNHDDRGELYLALYHLATKIYPNTEFISIFDNPNTFMSELYIKKDMM